MSIAVSLRKSSIFLLIAVSFLGGAIMGGGVDELRHRSAQATDRAAFSAKLRCQRIGQKYSTDHSTDGAQIGLPTLMTSVLKVDYSLASHSCIVETEDLNDCDKRSGEINDRLDALFAGAIAGKAKPIGR